MADGWEQFLWNRLDSIERSQRRIERKQDAMIAGLGQIIKLDVTLLNQERQDAMAIKDVIAQIQADARDNKDAADATKTALEGYAQANADLATQLKAAIAAVADEADVTALQEVAKQLEANNAELHAAAGPTAAAVVENTAATT